MSIWSNGSIISDKSRTVPPMWCGGHLRAMGIILRLPIDAVEIEESVLFVKSRPENFKIHFGINRFSRAAIVADRRQCLDPIRRHIHGHIIANHQLNDLPGRM